MAAKADVLVKVSTEATERFIEDYYKALNSARSTLSTFYIPSSGTDTTIPTILFNGNLVPDGAAVQEIFDKQMPPTRYEAQSVDCQVINPAHRSPDTEINTKSPKSHISILILVSGWVRYGEDRNDPQRGFSETFVLVPNPQAENQRAGRRVKDFLIQSQNFRLVV